MKSGGLEDMKSGSLNCLKNKTVGRIDLIGHVPNRMLKIALEVITYLTGVHGVSCLCFTSAASSSLSFMGFAKILDHTGRGQIVDYQLFCNSAVERYDNLTY